LKFGGQIESAFCNSSVILPTQTNVASGFAAREIAAVYGKHAHLKKENLSAYVHTIFQFDQRCVEKQTGSQQQSKFE